MLVIILRVQNKQSQRVLTEWQRETIEFELNNGWQKHLRVYTVQNHVLHKHKQCIPCSKVERLGSRMIRESLAQRKAYPMNSCGRTNRNF
jgi:hypothetical protein